MSFRKNVTKGLALGLAAVMVLGSAACGKKNGETSSSGKNKQTEEMREELAPEFVYVADYLPVDGEEGFYNVQFLGNKVYSLSGAFDEEKGQYLQSIKKYEINGSEIGAGESVLSFDEGASANQFYVNDEGEIYLIESRMNLSEAQDTDMMYGGGKPEYYLVKYQADGQKAFETSLASLSEGQDWFYAQYFCVDDKGRSYLCCGEQEIALLDEKGQLAGKIEAPSSVNWFSGMGTAKDGKVYVSYYKNDANQMSIMLSEVDFDNKKFGSEYSNFINGNNGTLCRGVGDNGDIIVSDSDALYEYSFKEQKAQKILTWLDCDINGMYIRAVSVDQDGKVLALIQDWESAGVEIALMKKMKSEEVVQKEKITIGTMYSDSRLSKQVVNFNKTSEKYHVSVKTYMDTNGSWSETSYDDAMTKFTNDILTGSGPDIIDVSSIDITNYVKKGVIEDLTPYLEKSGKLKKSDFFENVIEQSTYHGVLAYLPLGFTLNTLVAKTSEVGEKRGWTLQDMINYSKAHPNTQMLEYVTKDTMLSVMLMLNQEHYIDVDAGKCQLDSQDFKDLLLYANTFPSEEDDQDRRLTPHKLADGSLLLADAYISRFEDVQNTLAYFGDEKVTFIGYPSYDGGNGCLMTVDNAYAINSKSAKKEGAWLFLETMLTTDMTDDWSFFGFSTQKAMYEKQKEKALKIEYILDENGDPYLDENGDPIIAGSGGGYSMMGDDGEVWSYETHPVTKEEADIVQMLLDNAVCFNYRYDQKMMEIITEEAQSYFNGDKSVEDAASVIQNRVTLYLRENME